MSERLATVAGSTDLAGGAGAASEVDLAAGPQIDLDSAWTAAALDPVFADLDRELIGLAPVKRRIHEIAALLLIARLREQAGLTSERPTLHMSFTGGPGTGKTTVAHRMAGILRQLGYVSKGHLVVATRDDLVGQYVGHTAPRTKEMIKKAMGGVLFIDEAYYLYRRENDRDYGHEAIEMLLQAMENQREHLVVILAGYRDRMDTFFHANPGFHSRVAHHIEFPDYTIDELMQIAEIMLRGQMYEFDEDARTTFREYLRRRIAQPHFANARSVRNALDRIRLRQAQRLMDVRGVVPRHELSRIDALDVRRSRVFADNAPGAHSSDETSPDHEAIHGDCG